MMFSANLGFLWTEHALPDAIRAAKVAGFDAVECHWPYDVPTEQVRAALDDTGLPMLGLNTYRGDVAAGENGLSALPEREGEARAAIDQAIDYANAIDAQSIHVMAGNSEGDTARKAFVDNLSYACAAAGHRTILIEPLNAYDAPGYFLRTTGQAVEIIQTVGAPNLKLMFDCYHVARTEGEVLVRLIDVFEHVGHIQFAGVPSRGSPDQGTLDYPPLFAEIAKLGWGKPLGAEYKPNGPTENTLGWFKTLK